MTKLTWTPKRKPPDAESILEALVRSKVSLTGTLTISPTTRLPIRPAKGRRIDPKSPEGRAIAAKYERKSP